MLQLSCWRQSEAAKSLCITSASGVALAHMGVFIFAAGIMVSSGSRHEIGLSLLQPRSAGGTGGLYLLFRARLDLEAKATAPVKKRGSRCGGMKNALAACS